MVSMQRRSEILSVYQDAALCAAANAPLVYHATPSRANLYAQRTFHARIGLHRLGPAPWQDGHKESLDQARGASAPAHPPR